MVAIPPKGELGEPSLPRLLLDLHHARFDGRLLLSRDALEKSFLFQQGSPVFSESNRPSEMLGVQLMDSGRISREDYHRVSAYVVERKVKEGAALLELGLLDPKALFLALKHQVRGRLVECFGWPRGQFETLPEDAPEGAQPFRSDVYTLVQEGIETHWSPERVLTDLEPHMDAVVARNRRLSRVQERLLWDDATQAFIDALDGTRTLWRALQAAKTPRALAAAWLLHGIRAFDLREEAPDTEAAPPEIEIVTGGAARDATEARPRAAAADAGPADGDGGDEVLVLEISQKYVNLDDLDHYALLGVAQDASPTDVKRAYLDAAKRYHPDALARAGLDRETREKAGRVFAAIGKAHAVLSDPKRRRSYDASLASDDSDIDAERLAAAETNYRKGEILMRQGNFRGALEFLKPAAELWPEDGTYQGALGWALFKATPSRPVEARQHLERAYELEPRRAEIAYHLSIVLKALGEAAPSANLLAKAREIDPAIA